MTFSFSFVFILVYAVLYPLIVDFIFLKRIKNNLNETNNLKLYGVFYIGMNDDSYYWEVRVVNLRKLALIISAALLSGSQNSMRVSTFKHVLIHRATVVSSFYLCRGTFHSTRTLSWIRATTRLITTLTCH